MTNIETIQQVITYTSKLSYTENLDTVTLSKLIAPLSSLKRNRAYLEIDSLLQNTTMVDIHPCIVHALVRSTYAINDKLPYWTTFLKNSIIYFDSICETAQANVFKQQFNQFLT